MRLPTGQSRQHSRWSDDANNGAQAASAGPCYGCLQGSPCKLREDPGAHGNEQGGEMQNRTGAKMTVGSRHGMAKVVAGKACQNKAVVAKTAGE